MVNKTVLNVLKNVGIIVAGTVAGGVTVGCGVKGILKEFQKPVDESVTSDDDDDTIIIEEDIE